MRTSVTLDDDVHELASTYAHARGITLGAALSQLVRRGQREPTSDFSSIETAANGLPVFRSRGKILTAEIARETLDDDDE
jgi:hypothetical protein